MPKFTAELVDRDYFTAFRDVEAEGEPGEIANAILWGLGGDGPAQIVMSVKLREFGRKDGPTLAKAVGIPAKPADDVSYRILEMAKA